MCGIDSQRRAQVKNGCCSSSCCFRSFSAGNYLLKFRVIRSAIRETGDLSGIFWKRQSSPRFTMRPEAENSPLAKFSFPATWSWKKFRELAINPGSGSGADNPDLDIISPIMGMGNIRRALEQAMSAEANRLEKNLNFLATTGSTSPSSGCFGTVWA